MAMGMNDRLRESENVEGGDAGNMEIVPYTLTWDHFPHLVQMNIFQFLDRRSIENLRQASASARHLIETWFGADVVIPQREPVMSWGSKYCDGPSKPLTNEEIAQILAQVEGKTIRTLEIWDVPVNPAVIQFPLIVRHVRLHCRDIDLLNGILRFCVNLRSLQCYTGQVRHLDVIAEIVKNGQLVATVNSFPDQPYHLAHLKTLELTTGTFTLWGHVAFLLVALPQLPSLSTFVVMFMLNNWTSPTIHSLFMACLGDFLSKTPNLLKFKCDAYYDWKRGGDAEKGRQILTAFVDKYGSPLLKQIARQISLGSSVDCIQPLFSAAGRNLRLLSKVELMITYDLHNVLFTTLLRNLPQPSSLIDCNIRDMTLIPSERTPEMEARTRKVHKLFVLLHNDLHSPPPSYYQSLTTLNIYCSLLSGTTLAFSSIVSALPLLTTLAISRNTRGPPVYPRVPPNVGPVFAHFDENSNLNSFPKLEKLDLIGLTLGDLPSPNASIVGLVLQCRNLKEFNLGPSPNHANKGISIKNILQILSTLRKLNVIHVSDVYLRLTPELDSEALDPEDDAKQLAVQFMGGKLERYNNRPRRVVSSHEDGVSHNVVDYDFTFGNFGWEE